MTKTKQIARKQTPAGAKKEERERERERKAQQKLVDREIAKANRLKEGKPIRWSAKD